MQKIIWFFSIQSKIVLVHAKHKQLQELAAKFFVNLDQQSIKLTDTGAAKIIELNIVKFEQLCDSQLAILAS